MTMQSNKASKPTTQDELDKVVEDFANRIGSPWGEGATYEPGRVAAIIEETGEASSHLDDDSKKLFKKDLKALIHSHIQREVEATLQNVRLSLRGEDPDQYRPKDMVSMGLVEEIIDAHLATLKQRRGRDV